jgi:UDP:flavonoid glycosyltransferase YjiC (YdhE family)
VHRYIPQERLLPHCVGVVTNGGAGSILGALSFGLPLLIVPQGADHFDNADRAVAAGAAIRLMPDRLTADSARDAVRMLLHDDTFQAAAHRIENEFEAIPDPQQAVETLEQLTNRERVQRGNCPPHPLLGRGRPTTDTKRVAPRTLTADLATEAEAACRRRVRVCGNVA